MRRWEPNRAAERLLADMERGVRVSRRLAVTESEEQAAVVAWFRLRYPRHTILAIPNGAHLAGDARRRAMAMTRMKREGLEPGAADLLVAVPRFDLPLPLAGLWIEMKSKIGSLTTDQLEFGVKMGRAGYRWTCAHGADTAIAAIKTYMEGL